MQIRRGINTNTWSAQEDAQEIKKYKEIKTPRNVRKRSRSQIENGSREIQDRITVKHEALRRMIPCKEMLNIAAEYKKVEKDELPPVKLATAKVGKQAANKHLEQLASNFKSSDIGWTFGTC
ncbi:hypothetical protein EV1_015057 [Malus domestica]